MTERQHRRLAAILAADIAGYSALMGADEARTVRDLKAHQAVVLSMIASFGGRVIDTAGDGILVEFTSVVDAVECACAIQEAMVKRNVEIDVERRMQYRMGINVGDVMFDDARIYGDGINVAARLESIAEPGGICISSKVYEEIRGKVQLSYEDIGEQQLKNIANPVRVYRVRTTLLSPRSATILPLPEMPSIAVLPFQNISGDPEQEYFADGMVEEIITALSRIKWLFVIARNSSFSYKGQPVDVKRVGRELGVRYVLEGSVRKGGNRVRITAQLIEAETSAHLWADRFDGSLDDVFALQDQVAISVAGVMEPTLRTAEFHRSLTRPTADLTAYDLYLRAFEHSRAWQREENTQALDLLRKAIARDPQFGLALAQAAFCYATLAAEGASASDAAEIRRTGIELAHRALRVASNDPFVLSRAAYAFGLLGDDIDAAMALADRALEINPSDAHGWYCSGWLRLWAGQGDIAIDQFGKASRLSPFEMPARVLLGTGIGHFFARRFDEGRPTLRRALQEFPNWPPTYRFLAACYAQMGQLDAARQVIERLRSLTSVIVPDATHWRNAEQREFYLSGLRLAAGETT